MIQTGCIIGAKKNNLMDISDLPKSLSLLTDGKHEKPFLTRYSILGDVSVRAGKICGR